MGRCDVGKVPSPTVAIIANRSRRLNWSRGFDAHKKVKGRKRHIVTDIGIPLGVKVTDAVS